MDSFTFFSTAGIKNVLLLSAGTINLVFSAIIYFTDRHKKKNIFFSLLAVGVSAWAFSMAGFYFSSNLVVIDIFSNFLYISAASFPFFFFFFVNSMEKDIEQLPLIKKIFGILVFIAIVVLVNVPDFIITTPDDGLNKKFIFGSGYLLYGLYILAYFSISFLSLISQYRKTVEPIIKKQILFLFLGTFSASFICVMTNLILPFFGWWNLFWFGPVATILMVIFVGYSTIRHNLFNTKSVVVESVTFILWVAMLMRLFLSGNISDLIINSVLFILIVGGGLILIHAIYKEIETRENMEKLAKDLELANEHLRVLDKQKSEFVSIASHQLRTPLTAIIGYSSMLLEGSYGKLSDKAVEVVDKVYQSSRRLAGTIDDFLTISHIEQGKMVYTFTTVEMRGLLSGMIEEFSARAKNEKKELRFTDDGNGNYNVTADDNKIRQVLSNLIDNAIKYSQEGQSIEVSLVKDFMTNKTRISIHDSGIGMSPETINNLFQKFNRAKDVQKSYADGNGIGLYIAQEMMKSHHGRIWAESEGEGKGATFFVELMSEE